MNKFYRSSTLALTLAAGFAGGMLSRYVAPERVFAQTQAPPASAPSAPKEAAQPVRAQGFVLLDAGGRTAGVFAFDKKDGRPNIVLFDERGKAIWAARPDSVLVPLTQK